MKFVYFGYDFMLPGLHRLLDDGHDLMGIFTFECDNIFNFNIKTIKLGQDVGAETIMTVPKEKDLNAFINDGCKCFLSAGYPYKIPPINEDKAFGINVHPSLLPKGRGIMPTPYIIMSYPEVAGITVHKLKEKFDTGEILFQEALPLTERETVETLSVRIAMRSPEILSNIFADLPDLWENAMPQNPEDASHFPLPKEKMRTLDWSLPVQKLDATARAFGRFGTLAYFEAQLWVVYALDVWEESHNFDPGTVACRQSREIVIAAKNGFVCLKDFQIAQA